jgi:hypothetical protein
MSLRRLHGTVAAWFAPEADNVCLLSPIVTTAVAQSALIATAGMPLDPRTRVVVDDQRMMKIAVTPPAQCRTACRCAYHG